MIITSSTCASSIFGVHESSQCASPGSTANTLLLLICNLSGLFLSSLMSLLSYITYSLRNFTFV